MTLSRRHPKIKDQFEARRKELEAEIAAAEAKQKRSRDPSVASERIDPRWRIVEDKARVKGAQPFIIFEQAFIAIGKGGEDLVLKTQKLGTTPIAVTLCTTTFEQLMAVFEAYMSPSMFAAIDHARSKDASEYSVHTDLLRDTSAMISGYALTVRENLTIAAKGGSAGHEKVDVLQDVMPAFIAEMLALVDATKEALLPIAPLIGDGEADQVAFLAECLGETGALSKNSIVTFVAAKSGMDADPALAQEYIDAVKAVRGAEFDALVPILKRALKQSAGTITW